jgi:hypothetical protein
MKLENLNDHLMVMAAARYCIGRRSYIVSACIEFLTQVWDTELNEGDRAVILRDIIEYLQDYGAKDGCDAEDWRFFAQSRFDVLTEEEKENFRKNNAYRNKPFPL